VKEEEEESSEEEDIELNEVRKGEGSRKRRSRP